MKKNFVVVTKEINNLNGGREYSNVMSIDEYESQLKDGMWGNSLFEPYFFESFEKAEEFAKPSHVLVYCYAEGNLGGYSICSTENKNVYMCPNLYDIVFEGTKKECEDMLNELEKMENN